MQCRILIALSLAAAVTLPGHAAHALTPKVRSPYVDAGEWALEAYGAYSFDNDDTRDSYAFKNKFELGYGVNDWWKVGVEGVIVNEPGDNTAYDATELISKFQFWEKGAHVLDMGAYVAWEIPRDARAADKVELFLLASKQLHNWRHRANLVFEKEVGGNAHEDLELAFAWQSFTEIVPQWKGGVEYYAEFGEVDAGKRYSEQVHRLGPVFQYEWHDCPLEISFGYLVGISSAAPDSTLKWEVEYAF